MGSGNSGICEVYTIDSTKEKFLPGLSNAIVQYAAIYFEAHFETYSFLSYLRFDLIKLLLYYRFMDTFAALAEPTRRNILEMLSANGELSATDIYKKFPATPPAISQHLKVLREANLVRVEKRAQKRIYYVNPEPMRKLEKWIKQFAENCEERYRALDNLLQIEKAKLVAKQKENK
jgi:DNA-binding transcriptional ArsR family regulator